MIVAAIAEKADLARHVDIAGSESRELTDQLGLGNAQRYVQLAREAHGLWYLDEQIVD